MFLIRIGHGPEELSSIVLKIYLVLLVGRTGRLGLPLTLTLGIDARRARRARSAPREAPPDVVELRGGADLARKARV